jgi:hypothetical protein
MLVLRVVLAAAGIGLVAFVLIAWVLGPMTPAVWLAIGWSLVFATVAGAVTWAIQPVLRLRHHGALGLVAAQEPSLLSPLQTAYELQEADGFSRELVVAQRVGVLRSLEDAPARKFIPWRWVAQPTLALVVALAAVAWWSLDFDRIAAGRYALLHADPIEVEGASVSHVVGFTRAELLYPDYMNRPNSAAEDSDHLRVPRGTAVEYSISPIGDAARVVVELPGRHVEARRAADGFVASFVADTDGPFEIFVESASGERRVDFRARSIEVAVDEAPEVRLSRPEEDLTVEAREDVPIRYSASDDYAVRELTLLIKLPNGEHSRRPLLTEADEEQLQVAGETTLRLEEFSLAPADAVTIWLEAKDGNRVDGPGVGRSVERTLTLASDITRRRDRIAELEQLLDALLATLAYRLENDVPKQLEAAGRRRTVALGYYEPVASALSDVGDHRGPRTVPLLLDMRKRLSRVHQREALAYRSADLGPARKRSDRTVVQELEKDTLIVADLISEARLHDAAEIAREMQRLRDEIASLIGELRRGQTPELERALMAALDRAERRMEALRRQLREAMQYVPGEFVNRQAQQAGTSTDALQDVREALANGDLDAAEAALTKLDQMIEAMTKALSNSEDSLVEAKFGPRERALMQAMDTIRDLEVEQGKLAQKARRVRDRALERSAGERESMGSETRGALDEIANDVSRMLGEMDSGSLGPYESAMRTRAQDRLDDFGKALESGDVGEAMAMADRVAQASGALAKDLELSAMMYRGQNGRTADAAAQAREAAARARDLQLAARDAMPDVSGSLTDRERQQLGQQASDQSAAQQATHDLARRLREEVGGVPVSEQAAEQLEAIERPMQRAEQALDSGDPAEAHKQQRAAADQLRRLRQSLESQQRSRSGAGGDGNETGQSARRNERVEIPAARSRADELAWRRRVLDAMNGRSPSGYEEAVDDYYERLLR